MVCHNCSSLCKKFGKFGPQKIQRYRCKQCKRTFSEEHEKAPRPPRPDGPLGQMRISLDRAEMCLKLLLEGMSIRSVQRVTGLHQETILNLIVLTGERCEKLFETCIKGIAVKDVEADELWQFVQCKNRHKLYKGITDPKVGDAYTWVGIERNTKLVLAWHLGERDMVACEAFTEKLHEATQGRFQLTTDGFRPYENAVSYSLGTGVDYAMLIKVYQSEDHHICTELPHYVAIRLSFRAASPNHRRPFQRQLWRRPATRLDDTFCRNS